MRAEPLSQVAPLRVGIPAREAGRALPAEETLRRLMPPRRPFLSFGTSRVDGKAGSTPWCVSPAKRAMDVAAALFLSLLAAPLCILIALAIKIESRGPVFFRQWRTGLFGRRFRIFKFRTMVRDAEERKESLKHLNRYSSESPDFKIVDDPRVTRIGRLLRKTSIDELPNLLNVLKGDMSLIGPRPTSFGVERYEDWHLVRLTVPPGMTGLWQVSGRSELDFDERVRLDYRYIQEQSFSLDVKILAVTPLRVFERRGAF